MEEGVSDGRRRSRVRGSHGARRPRWDRGGGGDEGPLACDVGPMSDIDDDDEEDAHMGIPASMRDAAAGVEPPAAFLGGAPSAAAADGPPAAGEDEEMQG
eukprot:9487923-Pyramimonas_sp.AAC.1